MPPVHGKDAALILGMYDLTTYFNDMSLNRSVDLAEVNTFGMAYKQRVGGLKDASVSLGGVWDGAVNAVDARLSAMLGSSTVCTFFPNGYTNIGGHAMLMAGVESSYEVGVPIGDAVSVSASLEADGSGDMGAVLAPLVSRSTTGTTNLASVDFGPGSTSSNGFVVNIHRTATTFSPTVAIEIQDSADNATFATVTGGNFVGITVGGSSQTIGTASVRRYVRVQYAVAGASTAMSFLVALAKR